MNHKIKALFTLDSDPQQMDVKKAIITRNKVWLKPVGSTQTVTIKAEEVDIVINGLNKIDEECFEITDAPNEPSREISENPHTNDSEQHRENNQDDVTETSVESKDLDSFMKPLKPSVPKKKIIRLSLYPDEYEMIKEKLSENGYKRTEFLLACVTASKKKSFLDEYNRYTKEHKMRRHEERESTNLQAQEEVHSNIE